VSPRARAWAWRAAQLGASLLVLGLLARDVDIGGLRGITERLAPGWLGLALAIKTFTLYLHEQRLWLAFNTPRPPLRRVLGIGFAAGVLNLVLPGRAGDIASVAMLRRETGVSVGAATAAVGVASFLEAAVFGALLLVVLGLGAGRWQQVIGTEAHGLAMQWVTLATLGGVAVAVLATLISRRVRPPEDAAPAGPGPVEVLRDTLRQAGQNFSTPAALLTSVGLAIVQVVGMVGAFALAFPAVGLDIPLPMLAAAGVLAISSVASIVLPPSFGASPATASVAVLAVFGVSQGDALAYAAAWWLVSQVPATIIGLPCLWGRDWRPDR
jgi:uncharacterized membrane protein YbhN (UPF0104 family)